MSGRIAASASSGLKAAAAPPAANKGRSPRVIFGITPSPASCGRHGCPGRSKISAWPQGRSECPAPARPRIHHRHGDGRHAPEGGRLLKAAFLCILRRSVLSYDVRHVLKAGKNALFRHIIPHAARASPCERSSITHRFFPESGRARARGTEEPAFPHPFRPPTTRHAPARTAGAAENGRYENECAPPCPCGRGRALSHPATKNHRLHSSERPAPHPAQGPQHLSRLQKSGGRPL